VQAAQNTSHYSQYGLTIGRDDPSLSLEDVEIFDLDINPALKNIIALGGIYNTSVYNMIIMEFNTAGLLKSSF
jgi:hypothetical protein